LTVKSKQHCFCTCIVFIAACYRRRWFDGSAVGAVITQQMAWLVTEVLS